MNATRRCAACGKSFVPCPTIRNQRFCSAPACQRKRKAQWQREKLRTDPDYRENQARVQAIWQTRHPAYWQGYRARHPAYAARNRAQQRLRNWRRSEIAKMDVLHAAKPFPTGLYVLRAYPKAGIAKMDEYPVQIVALPRAQPGMG